MSRRRTLGRGLARAAGNKMFYYPTISCGKVLTFRKGPDREGRVRGGGPEVLSAVIFLGLLLEEPGGIFYCCDDGARMMGADF